MKSNISIVVALLYTIPTLKCKAPLPADTSVDLIAVTRFEDIENFYKSQRTSRVLPKPHLTWEEKHDKNLRRELCRRIFRSVYFEANDEDWIDMDNAEVKRNLRKEYPVIFNAFYALSWNPFVRFFQPEERKYVRKNEYELRRVSLNDRERLDHAFVCLVKSRQSNRIKEYFVSRAYNVNNYRRMPIGARFIFLYDREREELKVHALAERPLWIKELGQLELEMFYLRNKENYPHLPSKNPKEDLLCSLRPADKLRLCAVFLSSEKLRDTVKFTPSLTNVALACEMKIICFQSNIARERAGDHVYQEWTIGCTASSKANNEELITYYVSRSYKFNDVFAYRPVGDQMSLEYYGSDASMVHDFEEMLEYLGIRTQLTAQSDSREEETSDSELELSSASAELSPTNEEISVRTFENSLFERGGPSGSGTMTITENAEAEIPLSLIKDETRTSELKLIEDEPTRSIKEADTTPTRMRSSSKENEAMGRKLKTVKSVTFSPVVSFYENKSSS